MDQSQHFSGIALTLSSAQVSRIGGRTTNQDALGCAQVGELSAYVIADGVGGYEGGEIAAACVVESVVKKFVEQPAFSVDVLAAYINHAVTQLAKRKSLEPRLQYMSSTLVALLIDQQHACAHWAHVGDSRLYLFRDQRLRFVSRDHSVVQEYIDAGYCSVDDIRSHPQRNILTAAIGFETEVAGDATPDVVPLQAGDALLLCTDGFWEAVIETEMEQLLAAAASADEWLQALCTRGEQNSAVDADSRDNYTAFAIFVSVD